MSIVPSIVPIDAVQPSLAPPAEGALRQSARLRGVHSWATMVDLHSDFIERRLLTHSISIAAAREQRCIAIKQH